MSIENLLSRLDGVRRTGQDRWIARCPAHEDRSPSFSLRELKDGRILIHCFAGCEVGAILSAMGLAFDDLFPKDPGDYLVKRVRRPYNAIDVLRCVGGEALLVAVAAADVAKNKALSAADRERLLVAVTRIQRAVEVSNA